MNDEPGPAHSPTLPGHQPKIVATGQSCGRGEHASQADRRLRPLPRRAARIARPARVRMRSRNPWVRDRRRLFGWKVRLLTVGLPIMARQVIVPADVRRPGHNARITDGRRAELTPHLAGDLIRLRTPDQRLQSGCPSTASGTAQRHAGHGQMLATGRILWHSAALVSVRALGWPDGSGSPAAPRKLCRTFRGFRCGPSYLRAQLWTNLWMLPVGRVATEARRAGECPGGRRVDMTEGRRGEGSS
jgi:hypothetical protein